MIRAMLVAVCLPVLAAANLGCGNAPKDQIPTKLQQPPREPPASGQFEMFPKEKK
jgi:hypothetical protein